MKKRSRGIWRRGSGLSPDDLRPLGLLADSPCDVAGICSAIDRIGAYAWTSYGGWSEADGVARRGWVQARPIKGPTFLLQLLEVFGAGVAGSSSVHQPGGGWLNVEIRPHQDGPGSTIEVRGDLDAEMHDSVRDAMGDLRMTMTRTWDPTVP
jgi:hypothetical protein